MLSTMRDKHIRNYQQSEHAIKNCCHFRDRPAWLSSRVDDAPSSSGHFGKVVAVVIFHLPWDVRSRAEKIRVGLCC